MQQKRVLWGALLVLAAVWPALQVAQAGAPTSVQLFFTGDLFGYLKPCG